MLEHVPKSVSLEQVKYCETKCMLVLYCTYRRAMWVRHCAPGGQL